MNYPDIVNLGIENTTKDIERVLRQFPFFMQESDLMQWLAVVSSQEIGSKARDTLDDVYRNSVPSTVEQMGIPYWQILLNYPSLHGDTLEVARARILTKTVRFQRRVTDIANLVRLYLAGNRTYTSASVNHTNLVPVNDVDGFITGQLVWVGPTPAIITEIDALTSSLKLDRDVVAHVFELVSDSPVVITQSFPIKELYDDVNNTFNSIRTYDADTSRAYMFFIFVEKSRVLSLRDIIEAVTDARPAHLNFQILSYPPILYRDPLYTYIGELVDPALYVNAAPYSTPDMTYGGISNLSIYDSPSQTYDNAFVRYNSANETGILYNGSEILYGGI